MVICSAGILARQRPEILSVRSDFTRRIFLTVLLGQRHQVRPLWIVIQVYRILVCCTDMLDLYFGILDDPMLSDLLDLYDCLYMLTRV